ncbi:MAG: class I SAM-dependent methyltransferase [Thaumarchaeota archaeon]|nr:class I SAM-dependent methyltransferase [Nitrososphaerota archaeon]
MTAGWRRWHDRFSRQSAGATDKILELAKVREGMKILDIACGSGEPSLSLARTVGPTGRVVAADIVPGMLQIAEENAQNERLSNIEFRVADAEAIPLPDGYFDAVTCRFGVMFFSDPERAMREARRVLKDGGLIVLVTWGPLKDNPRFTTTTSILEKHLRSSADADPQTPARDGNLFKFANQGSLSGLLRKAGFTEISEEYLKIPWIWEGSAEELFRSFSEMSAPFRKMWSAMDKDSQRRAADEILSAIGKYYDGTSVDYTAVINTAVGRKSG